MTAVGAASRGVGLGKTRTVGRGVGSSVGDGRILTVGGAVAVGSAVAGWGVKVGCSVAVGASVGVAAWVGAVVGVPASGVKVANDSRVTVSRVAVGGVAVTVVR